MKAAFPIPKNVAQFTGMLVTGIVVFGTDVDVTYAVPLGIFAGALALFFVSLSETEREVQALFGRLKWRSSRD